MENREDRIGINLKVEEKVKVPKKINKGKSIHSEKYMNPPIPEGCIYIFGEWNDGFIIEDMASGEFFYWQPIGALDEYSKEFFSNYCSEAVDSIEKYEGFYISCENISNTDLVKFMFVK